MTHLLSCPACGPFGIRARRRNRRAADAALVRFWAQLAAEVRAERAKPRVTFYDSRFRRIAGPMTSRQLAEAGIELVSV
ncbi:hypothetical protein PP556_14380 [Mycobacteroides abscessus]|nr:hypothetical protein [Mycobacteroides abscessus]MDM2451115.1 hypothetical protein [Mycobacteroides abscessus]MDM2455739.1 hypothetical protein [Mycobacteroides abscessus]MDM2460491.1 hypothetical protein [Mycobacteroides abscessus]MDM2466077.1 hypothetical protein [Mycobacteroides abscessus]